jgi:hypothetical protein
MALNIRNEIINALNIQNGMYEQQLHAMLLSKHTKPSWFSRMRKPAVSLHELREALSALVIGRFLRIEWTGKTISPYRPVRYFLVRR